MMAKDEAGRVTETGYQKPKGGVYADGTEHTPHPAKFSSGILDALTNIVSDEIREGVRVRERTMMFDPFGGVGGLFLIADRARRVTGHEDLWANIVELEPEWAAMAEWTRKALGVNGHVNQADFFEYARPLRNVGELGVGYDMVVTSPVYGNRMSDHHDPSPRDKSTRNTYRHKLGRPLTDGNAGMIQWGERYRGFHLRAWANIWNLLNPGGLFVLNVKDHVRRGHVEQVSAWHEETCRGLGFVLEDTRQIEVTGNGFGANGQSRVPFENLYLFRKVG